MENNFELHLNNTRLTKHLANLFDIHLKIIQ